VDCLSNVVLKAVLGLEGPDLLLESCTDNVLASPSDRRKIIKLIIVIITNYY